MHKLVYRTIAIALICSLNPVHGWCKNLTSNRAGSAGLQQRIHFGNSYIMGQSIKSGAVYLLHRKQSEIKSMLQYRQHYRREILQDFKVREQSIADQPETNPTGATPGKTAARE